MADNGRLAHGKDLFFAAMKSYREEILAMQSWPWMVAATALLFSVPWVLFMSDAAFRFYDSELALFSAFAVHEAAFALAVWLVAIRGASKLRATNGVLNDVAAICFCAGVLLMAAVDALPTDLTLAKGTVAAIGALASGASYGALFVIWVLPYSRHSVLAVSCAASLAMALVVVVASVAKVVIDPLGIALFALAYPLVFLAARRAVKGRFPAPTDLVGSTSKGEVFVLQDKKKMFAIVGFSYFMSTLFLMRLRTDAPDAVRYAVPLALAISALLGVLVVALFAKGRSSVSMALFIAGFGCIHIGGMVAQVGPLFYAGAFVVLCGHVFLDIFYVTYYSAICKRKGFSDARSSLILGKTALVLPISLVSVWLVLLVEAQVGSAVMDAACLVGEIGMVVVMLAMFSDELSRTRTELAQKQDTSISLKDVLRFADETRGEFHLTERECEVIQQVMSGRSVAAAAKELYLSESTVKTHMRSIYKKLDVHNRQEMIGLINSRMA